MRPLELGGRVAPVGVDPDTEATSLLSPESQLKRHYDKTYRPLRIMAVAVVCTLIVTVSVFVALGATIWRVNSEMEAVRASLAPHAEQVINSTLSMIADTRDTLHNLHTVTDSGTTLATSSVPHLMTVTNNTASISDRIAELLRHPEIKLSLGG
tara:strand:- start:285 stop:746 length:462 start_codon:yes stop_codon:yes gene_type:complete